MKSLGHEGCPRIKDGSATRVNKWSTAYGMRIQRVAISNEKLSSFDADDEPQPGNGRQWSKGGKDGKQRGTVNFSLAFAITNTTESQPYDRRLHPHTKDRILNSRLESVSWHSLATVAPAECPVAGSVQCAVRSIQYPVSSGSKCNLANVHVSWANIFIGFLGWSSLGSGRRIRSASKMHLQRG